MYLFILFLLIALSILLGLRRRRSVAPPAALEYWVYLPTTEPPSQDAILTKLFNTGAIGPSEGLLFSDIRLHFAVMLRARNAHLFMMDLLEEAIPLSADRLDDLAESQAIMKIRYVCDPPASDDRYIKLLPQIARVSAELTGARTIYDLYQRRIFSLEELTDSLKVRGNANSADFHVRVLWSGPPESRAETRGMRKKRLPDLVTDLMESDEENLVSYVLQEAAKSMWNAGTVQQTEVEYFGSHIIVEVLPYPSNAIEAKVRLLRKEPV